jgi:excisionase family DNA binding protein
MLALMDQVRDPFVASEEEAVIAREATSRLKPIAEAKQDVRLRVMESPDVVVPVPARALEAIFEILSAMAERKPVSFIPHEAELTTQQAADALNVSRPHLVGHLEQGKILFRKVGSHRRVRVADLNAFKAASLRDRRAAIAEVIDEAKRLNLD